jgi:hypothetical protein
MDGKSMNDVTKINTYGVLELGRIAIWEAISEKISCDNIVNAQDQKQHQYDNEKDVRLGQDNIGLKMNNALDIVE